MQLPAEAISESVDWQLVTNVFTQLLRDADQPPVELGAIIGGGWESTRNTEGNTMSSSGISNEEFLERARAYASRLDASLSAFPRGHAFVNGKHFELDDVRDQVNSLKLDNLLIPSLDFHKESADGNGRYSPALPGEGGRHE